MFRTRLLVVVAGLATSCGGPAIPSFSDVLSTDGGVTEGQGDSLHNGDSSQPNDGAPRGDSLQPNDGSPHSDHAVVADRPMVADRSTPTDGPTEGAQPFANETEAENALPGSAGWELTKPATERQIEGYAGATSVNQGQTIELFVNTSAARYDMEVYRLGWYQGKGARLMSEIRRLPGQAQTIPLPDAAGMVECKWKNPYRLAIPGSWVSGVYLAKLIEGDNLHQAYIIFVVRDDARASDFLFQSSVTTFQAYNDWGGHSLYGDAAQIVSFDRPYAIGPNWGQGAIYGAGAGEFLTNSQDAIETVPRGWEYNMVRFLEREGYDVTYATNIDLHANADLLDNHRALLSVGHDEYWSWEMRDNAERARDAKGVSLGFFAANTAYWQARFAPNAQGTPNRRMICYKDALTTPSDPLRNTDDEHLVTALWRGPTLDRPEVELMGVTLQSDQAFADLVVSDASSWAYADTGLKNGDAIPGLVGYEADGMATWAHPDYSPATKPIAHSPFSSNGATWYADMVTFELPSGATVFSTGTIQWSWGLDDYRPPTVPGRLLAHPAAQQITRNVLARLRRAASPLSKPPLVWSEGFDGANPEQWRPGTLSEGVGAYDASVGVVYLQGQLVISPRANWAAFAHGGLLSRPFDLRSAAVSVEVKEVTSPTSAAGTTFAIAVDENNWIRFYVEGSALFLQRATKGIRSAQRLTHDPVRHPFWRLRTSMLDGKAYWEISADGTSWTIAHQVSLDIDLGAARIELSAGTYQAEPVVGQAIFDNLVVAHNGFSDTFRRSRNPMLWRPALLTATGASDPRVALIQHKGTLQIRPRSDVVGTVYGGYLSTYAWDFTGAVAQVEAASSTGADPQVASYLAVVLDRQRWLRIGKRGGLLVMEQSNAGSVSSQSLPFSDTAHRWWRLQHEASTDRVSWQTSPDRATWTVHRSETRSLPLQDVYAELSAGTDAPVFSPGQANFRAFAMGH